MLNQTYMFENAVAPSNQKIAKMSITRLANIPITPPPYRDRPNKEGAMLLRVETNDGVVGWATSGYTHPVIVDLIDKYITPRILGEDPFRTERIPLLFDRHTYERPLGRAFVSAMALVDIALWDIKGKTLGKPVHVLLGGARDRVPVYVTHGAAYDGAQTYSAEELAAEAAYLVKLGNTHVKNTVGRQAIPDPKDDYRRMKAMREAIGPDVKLSMDGNLRMSISEAVRLCKLCEELDIAFIEEPIYYNDPATLAHLRSQTTISVAAAENEKFTALQLLQAGAVDFIQPNINNDGGLSASLRIAAIARAFNIPLGHGNGNGPHNIALHAGIGNGGLVEYHYHKWMAYNALFEEVPQPEDGWLRVSLKPGFGLEPKDGVIKEYSV
ncbi:mandelate racemase/muconate lactonizing enzyme family protein [Microvirga puerhi]|uniref:Mandelate racemase/muconate lactonizing enzyme family protein n=1 Tax=Microvirga puerhi TaxID=2876078 RepID=A0ABS7VK30_9HYPH|nr:mandelate racemase/muconate lactonizing enzyme family protein [Microvirga puerhi]MBZ6075889.1 mandelate racemase/muconate lactonizing enzyme family protein [Microvirga puerhi]